MDGDFSVPAYYAHGRFQLALRRSDVERLAPRSATPQAEFLIRSIPRGETKGLSSVPSGVTPLSFSLSLSLSLSLAERIGERLLPDLRRASLADLVSIAQSRRNLRF